MLNRAFRSKERSDIIHVFRDFRPFPVSLLRDHWSGWKTGGSAIDPAFFFIEKTRRLALPE